MERRLRTDRSEFHYWHRGRLRGIIVTRMWRGDAELKMDNSFKRLVGPPGFEPGTSCTPSKRRLVSAVNSNIRQSAKTCDPLVVRGAGADSGAEKVVARGVRLSVC